jgi:hypothetical protein
MAEDLGRAGRVFWFRCFLVLEYVESPLYLIPTADETLLSMLCYAV